MIPRRAFLAAGAAFAALPLRAQPLRFGVAGTMEQGTLSVGTAEPGAKVSIDGQEVRVSPTGIFAFGFAYDQTEPVLVQAQFADGTVQSRAFTPVIRHYEIQQVNGLPQVTVTPPPEMLARIHREAAYIRQIRKRDSAAIWFAGGFDWPAAGILSSVYGSQRIDNGTPMAPHLGVDIAAPKGTPIHAPADGIVTIADSYILDGNFTMLDHGQGVSTCYLHQSELRVKAGDRVRRGQLIGLMGQSGRATGPNLHWGLSWFDVKLDPSRSTPTPMPPGLPQDKS
jgi:murein DD-endopeptidase MepM/ murein hydrolase activator NlpD